MFWNSPWYSAASYVGGGRAQRRGCRVVSRGGVAAQIASGNGTFGGESAPRLSITTHLAFGDAQTSRMLDPPSAADKTEQSLDRTEMSTRLTLVGANHTNRQQNRYWRAGRNRPRRRLRSPPRLPALARSHVHWLATPLCCPAVLHAGVTAQRETERWRCPACPVTDLPGHRSRSYLS